MGVLRGADLLTVILSVVSYFSNVLVEVTYSCGNNKGHKIGQLFLLLGRNIIGLTTGALYISNMEREAGGLYSLQPRLAK
ncbi:hypothetical protein ACN38_g2951 [Penicillium nordicum]|uniref:Uncharacterized protein n=1 Tax=Penicillium nordicum TaxID=229535 RepID=A0A0M9WIH1_9EURO|nr:hypothetical protein ACN38_g2951 [Penicillium nordicum]